MPLLRPVGTAAGRTEGLFKPTAKAGVRNYCIVIPPPNVTGILHMGHALNDTLQDVLIRYAPHARATTRCWLPGTDHAGIATQNVVEKVLRKEGLTKEDLGREEFVEARLGVEGRSTAGTSSSSSSGWAAPATRRASASPWTRASRAPCASVFVALYEKGYIYRGRATWSTGARAAARRSPTSRWCTEEMRAGSSTTSAIRSRRRGRAVTVATTRPETMLGDTAVAVQPGRRALRGPRRQDCDAPAAGPDDPDHRATSFVDTEFGTGALKITPAHDLNDFDIGRTHGLEAVQASARTAASPRPAARTPGLELEEARERVVEDLRRWAAGEKVEDYPHSVGHLRPLRHARRAAHQRAVVHGHGPAQGAGPRGRGQQGRVHRPGALGTRVLDWMENLRPGASAASSGGVTSSRSGTAPAATITVAERTRRPAPSAARPSSRARPTCSTPGSARPVAVRHLGLAGPDPGPRRTSIPTPR